MSRILYVLLVSLAVSLTVTRPGVSEVGPVPAAPGSGSSVIPQLETPPSWMVPIRADRFQGIPLFGQGYAGYHSLHPILFLLEIGSMRNVQDLAESAESRKGCELLQTVVKKEVLEQFADVVDRGGLRPCGWHGANEFARRDVRQSFYDQYGAKLLGVGLKSPITVAVVDSVTLASYDDASSSFLLMEDSGGRGFKELMQRSARKTALKHKFDWPTLRLPVPNEKAARELVKDVTSWALPSAVTGKPLRILRRVTVIELSSFDTEKQRIDVELKSIGLYNLDLSRLIHQFPLDELPRAFASAPIPERLTVASPAPLDPHFLTLKSLTHFDDALSDTAWTQLERDIALRDSSYWFQEGRGPPPDLPPDDARRPFFHKDGTGDRDRFKEWARAYAAGLPNELINVQQFIPGSVNDQQRHVVAVAPGSLPRSFWSLIESAGLQLDQVAFFSGSANVAVVVPNRVELYRLEVSADAIAPYIGERMERRTTFRIAKEELLGSGDSRLLLISVDPIATSLEADGKPIASTTFETIARLDDRFTAETPGKAQLEAPATAGAPLALSATAINLLYAANVDPDDEEFANLVTQRWHLEQSGEKLGGAFFVAGKRLPSPEEAKALARTYADWARARASDRIILKSKAPVSAGQHPQWSSLSCAADALSQNDSIRISANQRRLSAGEVRKTLAVDQRTGSWTREDDAQQEALRFEPQATGFVVRIDCHNAGVKPDPYLLYATLPYVLPAAPESGDHELEVRLAMKSMKRVEVRPQYLDLLPEQIAKFLVERPANETGPYVSLEAEPVEIVYRDASGRDVRHEPDSLDTLEAILANLAAPAEEPDASAGEPDLQSEDSAPYGFDMIGLKVGMTFEEAEAKIRAHMDVGHVLVGARVNALSGNNPNVIPASSGKLFISADQRELIAILDEAPDVEGRVLAAWRRIYFEPGEVSKIEVTEALRNKYGMTDARTIEEGTRNYWSTPSGNNCGPFFKHGGARPALSATWTENGTPVALLLPDGRPIPDVMLPMAMTNPLDPLRRQDAKCGPAFTTEFSFGASENARAGYPTHERDWIEQIISDVGPYISAFDRSRASLLARSADGQDAQTGSRVRF